MNFSFKLLSVFLFIFSFQLSAQNSSEVIKQIQKARQKNPDSAIALAQNFLQKFDDNVTKANVYIEISQCYAHIGNKNLAISYAEKAKVEALKTNDLELIPRVYGSLATQYRKASLLKNAKKEIKEGLDFVYNSPPNISYNWIKSAFLREYSRVLSDEKKLDSSIIYSHRALHSISIHNKDKKIANRERIYQNLITLDLAENHFLKNSLDSSEYYSMKVLEKSGGILTENNYKKSAKLNLSLVYYKKKQYERSLDTLKNIEKIIREDEYPLKADLYNYIAQNYKALNDTKNQEKYHTLYLNVKDKLTEDKVKAIDRLLLNLEKERQEEIDKNEFNRNLVWGLSLVGIFIIVSLLLFFFRKRKSEKIYYQKYIDKIKNGDYNKTSTTIEKSESNKESIKISGEVEQVILLQLQKFENSEKYIDSNLTLASKLKTNTKYLSEIIKKNKGQNYNAYINNLRIEYICEKIIDDPQYRKYKISSLAQQCGFSSVDTFSKVFKNITGILPSVFIENASKNDVKNNK